MTAMNLLLRTNILLLLYYLNVGSCSAFLERVAPLYQSVSNRCIGRTSGLSNNIRSDEFWSVADDWEMRSSQEEKRVSLCNNSDDFSWGNVEKSKYADSSDFIDDVIDSFFALADIGVDGVQLYDSKMITDNDVYLSSESFADNAAKEISLLIRCNEEPEALHIESGRALQSLSHSERYHRNFLIDENTGNPTEFFYIGVQTMFNRYAHFDNHKSNGLMVMDASNIAKWMSTCLDEKVTKFDSRVYSILTKFSVFGSGYLSIENFQCLYLDAIMNKSKNKKNGPNITDVWRDFYAHDIVSPIEAEHNEFNEKIRHDLRSSSSRSADISSRDDLFFDECEIISWNNTPEKQSYSSRTSSYKKVDLALVDGKTPIHVKDGDFVFIDEESCIGCTQCAQVAPSNFFMVESSGRARCHEQSDHPNVKTAVELCPVSCMHFVAFHELKEFESARDEGDGRSDHRHMQGGAQHKFTPLHVARRGTDANHKSSWYHYLKQKCHMTSSCPQRGCFDCPHYSKPGDNPYFKEISKNADKMRIREYIRSGAADFHRKFVQL